ncbi:outer membrane protein [Undibacter mobilis]|uniref:Porin family protein n=1 Tax=Undibacter mobilis TaxID=2292256 RepID=A0A371BBE2_9BRAD|nr:outer membrane protein [Undibacter mobilis]RDV04870.1 porin family protein [Undibacter mobilis]
MKRFVLAAAAIAVSIGAANAADMARRQAMPTKAPAYVAPIYNWSGFYAGINGGGGWGRSSVSGPLSTGGNFNTSGGLVGGTLGFNYQAGQIVYGLEGDIDWTNLKGSSTCAVGVSCEAKNNWLGTARGRIGYAFDRYLPYITGGLAVGDVKTSATGLGSASSTKAGWTLGGGVEAAIAGPWTAKVEYLYVDLKDANAPAGSSTDFRTNVVRGGLNYRF